MSEDNVVAFTPRERRTSARKRPAAPQGAPLSALISSWELALEAANKATSTIRMYLRSARMFVSYLEAEQFPDDAETVSPQEVRAFLVHERERAGVPTSAAHYSYLRVWFTWIIAEGERTTFSPVVRADEPHVPTKARKYLALDEITALLGTCKGSAFLERRDTAIILTFLDNGMRVSGLTGLRVEDVDFRGRRLRIVLKGGDEHWAPISSKTAQAIDRYIRVRTRHRRADSPWLFLGTRNGARPKMSNSGVRDMLRRRGEQAGVDNVHPHRFRGTSAHQQLTAGAHPDDVRRVLGWKTDAMLRHYTEELANERARAAHVQFSPVDRL